MTILVYDKQCSCPACQAYRRSLDNVSSAEASPEEIAGKPKAFGPVLISQNTIRAAKRKAHELLKASKKGEPLDQAQLQLVLRGYLGTLDLILSISDSNGTRQ